MSRRKKVRKYLGSFRWTHARRTELCQLAYVSCGSEWDGILPDKKVRTIFCRKYRLRPAQVNRQLRAIKCPGEGVGGWGDDMRRIAAGVGIKVVELGGGVRAKFRNVSRGCYERDGFFLIRGTDAITNFPDWVK